MACSFGNRLSAYHDGELDSASAAEVQRHVAECPACASELAELNSLSGLFEKSPRPRLSQMSLHRIHNGVDLVIRGNFLRTVKVLRAIAACVLVGASIWLIETSSQTSFTNPGSTASSQESVEAAPPWVDAAVTATAETQSLDATSPAAAWYLADFSSRSDDVP
jgi:anti-sigma factor RsiW